MNLEAKQRLYLRAVFYFGLFFSLIFITPNAYSQNVINIRHAQGEGDIAHSYFSEIIIEVLKRTTEDYGPAVLNVTRENLTQKRALKFLERGQDINIDWAGTNIERERKLRAIRIPLNMGLLGYRLLVIRKDRRAEFDKITSENQLKKLTACQGQHWPDSDILEDNGYTVNRTIRYELIWKMIDSKRCDYFPRAIIEGYGETKSFASDKYTTYDKILIVYRFPMYFFVNSTNAKLAQRVEQGLGAMLEDDSLLAIMKKHPASHGAFPLSKYNNSQIFHITNKYLSPETRSLPEKYWLNITGQH